MILDFAIFVNSATDTVQTTHKLNYFPRSVNMLSTHHKGQHKMCYQFHRDL